MVKRFLRQMGLLCALLIVPHGVLQAFSSTYSSGTTLTGQTTNLFAGGAGDFMSFDGTITISGDVVISATTSQTLTVSVGTSGSDSVYFQAPSRVLTPAAYGHLMLYAPTGGKILFYVNNDMIFTGSICTPTGSSAIGDATRSTDLIVTASGAGQIVFSVKGGKRVAFESWYQPLSTNGNNSSFTEMTTSGSGARFYIAMDDSLTRVSTYGINKVLFQRQSWTSTFTNLNIEFGIGVNSLVSFISTNSVGISYDGESTGYAAIGFDVSNQGRGRTVLNIKGGLAHQYFDGGLNLYGHFVANRDLSSTYTIQDADATSFTGAGIRDNIRLYTSMRHLGGRVAYLRVVDDLAYTSSTGYATQLTTQANQDVSINQAYQRRGLLVINGCKSVTPYAADPYGDNGWFNQDIANEYFTARSNGLPSGTNAPRQRYQPGFVLGANGHISIAHNTFLDYVATTTNKSVLPEGTGLRKVSTAIANQDSDPDDVLKKHNPSALVVDGLRGVYGQIAFKAPSSESRQATISMYGNGAITFRSGANKNGTIVGAATNGTDSVYSYTIGSGTYDGSVLPVTNETTVAGEYIFDIEGPLTLTSVADDYSSNSQTFERHNGSGSRRAGSVNLTSMKIDETMHEVSNDAGLVSSRVSRPLTKDTSYPRYNRPAMLVNADVTFLNTIFNHNDIAHAVTPASDIAEPAIVGGERANYETEVLSTTSTVLPIIALHNSNIDLHESLAVSGVRFVVRDLDNGLTGTATANVSKITFYNHGNALDSQIRGYARTFVLGTDLNEVANLGTKEAFNSAFVNVYRSTGDLSTTLTGAATLSLRTAAEGSTSSSELGTQVFWIGNKSTVSLGWTTTVGYRGYTGIDPFETTTDNAPTKQFELKNATHTPGTLSIDGDNFYFAGKDSDGNVAKAPIKTSTDPRCVFVNNGGKITINHNQIDSRTTFVPSTDRAYNAYIDTIIAVRQARNTDIAGIISLPRDQVQFGDNAIQPYNLDMSTLTDGQQLHLPVSVLSNGSQCSLAWDQLISNSGFTPVKSFDEKVRALQTITSPVTIPTNGMIKVSTGDYLDQMRVSGATVANPLSLYISGDENGFGQIRELTSLKTTNSFVVGEGQFASIFLDKGGKIGLGARFLNKHSLDAWNLLGRRNISIFPNGDGVIELNNNIMIADGAAIVPTTNFGTFADVKDGSGTTNQHTLIFTAQQPHEIRVPKGGQLDLSAFGQATTGTTQLNTQLIQLAGRVRLVIEPGATIKFPSLTATQVANGQRPVLYINENAELVFEGTKDRANKAAFSSLTQTSSVRSRIIGCGQIWLNKAGKVRIFDEAIVGIETDADTALTDITISIQREGQFLIGDANNVGGTFQIGNMSDVSGSKINFQLRLNGIQSLFNVQRLGFFGLGTGVYDQSGSTINNWKLMSLFNVNKVNIRHIKGAISMNSIYNGASTEGTVFAVGPIAGDIRVELGKLAQQNIRGGSSMIFTTTHATSSSLVTPSILTTAADMNSNFSSSSNNGCVHMFGSAPIIFQKTTFTGIDSATSIAAITSGTASESGLVDGQIMVATGRSNDLFKYLSFGNYVDLGTKFVTLTATKLNNIVGFVADGTISRISNVGATDLSGAKKNPSEVLELGYLGATGTSVPGGLVVIS